MKTIITGMRDFHDYETVVRAVAASGFAITEVVSGCAPGVDTLGEQLATARWIPVKKLPADWKTHGRAGGPIRNAQMADYAEALVAVWDGQSRGTGGMISLAREKGLQVHVQVVERP